MSARILIAMQVAALVFGWRSSASSQVSAQRAPEDLPLFGRGVFSTGAYELTPSFTPDGKTAYFTVSTPAYGRLHVIMETHFRNRRWTAPRMAPFSGRYGDADPMVSPDGDQLFFISKRPAPGDSVPRRDFDVWVMDQTPGGWGAPRHIPEASGADAEHYVSVTADGTLYIAALRPDSRGRGDLYRVPLVNGNYGAPENLGPAVNSADHHDTTPWVAPDESFMIYSSFGRPEGSGTGGDLYISFRRNGEWTPARRLGGGINSRASEYCPVVSPDGEYLYFTSERGFADRPVTGAMGAAEWNRLITGPGNGLGDVYRVKMREVLEDSAGYVLPYPVGASHEVWQTTGHYTPGNGGVGRYAIDFRMPIGTPVVAARGGVVVAARDSFPDGNNEDLKENFVFIRHEDGTVARYFHLTRGGALVEEGDTVRQGQQIARSGNSGQSAGPHLHFDVQRCGPNLPPEYNKLPCGHTVPVRFLNAGAESGELIPGRRYRAMATGR